jgi:hypothetical protein
MQIHTNMPRNCSKMACNTFTNYFMFEIYIFTKNGRQWLKFRWNIFRPVWVFRPNQPFGPFSFRPKNFRPKTTLPHLTGAAHFFGNYALYHSFVTYEHAWCFLFHNCIKIHWRRKRLVGKKVFSRPKYGQKS